MIAIIQTTPATTVPVWKPATWEDYLAYRDDPTIDRVRLFFYQDHLLTDMGSEGINHAIICELFSMIFAFWFSQKPEEIFSSLGGCLLEKPPLRAGAPDIILYLGEGYPRWQSGERRYINLNEWLPNLVGEIADTTLATDLDEKKHLYAALGIPEYWVVDVRGQLVIVFQLDANGNYQQCDSSLALAGLPISLLEQTVALLNQGTNGSAALWFAQQIANLNQDAEEK